MSACLKSILKRCRSNPELAFIPGFCNRARIVQLAASICRLKKHEPLCLCTADKTLVASALLAAAHNGPRLVLPHAFSRQALSDARESTRFNSIFADAAVFDIPGADLITPDMLTADCRLPDELCAATTPIAQLFTGGSTGQPKVWSKTPGNLFGEAWLLSHTFNISPEDIIAATVPPQHIYGLLFGALVPLVANCSVLEPAYTFPQEILSAIQHHGTTILVSVPVHYHVLKASALRRHSLRLAFSSAGVLNPHSAAFFYTATELKITEIFGSTETGGIAWRQSPTDGTSWRTFENVQWKIEKQLLLARSDFLSPELPRDDEGFFTTSDRASPCSQKSFTLHGRADTIVKVGGKRVDLDEVCTKIRQIREVTDAAVFALPTPKGRGSEIAALVVGSIDAPGLRLRLSKLCEPYACPRHIKTVQTIPLLATGKHDLETMKKIFSKPTL